MAILQVVSRVAPIVLAGFGVAALVACGSDDDTDKGAPTQPTSTTTVPTHTSTTDPAAATSPAATSPAAGVSTSAPITAEPSSTAPGGTIDATAAAELQSMLDAALLTLPSPNANVQAAVVVPQAGIEWAATAGPDNDVDRPFRMASVGKTFTAATVLRLVEDGAIGLDDPIGALLLPETVTLLESDGYDLAMITVAHLLQHTAGLYDYAFGDGSPFLEQALADRGRVWRRREQLELAVAFGDPLFAPGSGFRYSDTAYVLLGEIIELETGQTYSTAMRELLGFDRLGLSHVWLETVDSAPADVGAMSRSFLAADEVSDLDFSLDAFGGGGLAGTGTDIARFFAALLGGQVFAEATTLTTMLTVPNTNLGQEEFGILLGDGAHGIYRIDIDGQVCWSHRGFLGTIAMACPDAGVSLVVTTNTALTDPLPVATQLLGIMMAN